MQDFRTEREGRSSMVGSTEPRSDDKQPCAASSRGRIIGTCPHDVLVDQYVGK